MAASRTKALRFRKRKRRTPMPRKVSLAPVRRAAARRAKRPLRAIRRPSWKLVGLAGLAGVAATGVVVARNRRAHGDLEPDELRERLHRRLTEVGAPSQTPPPAPPG